MELDKRIPLGLVLPKRGPEFPPKLRPVLLAASGKTIDDGLDIGRAVVRKANATLFITKAVVVVFLIALTEELGDAVFIELEGSGSPGAWHDGSANARGLIGCHVNRTNSLRRVANDYKLVVGDLLGSWCKFFPLRRGFQTCPQMRLSSGSGWISQTHPFSIPTSSDVSASAFMDTEQQVTYRLHDRRDSIPHTHRQDAFEEGE